MKAIDLYLKNCSAISLYYILLQVIYKYPDIYISIRDEPLALTGVGGCDHVYFATSRFHIFGTKSQLNKICDTIPSETLSAMTMPNVNQIRQHLINKMFV